VGVVRAGCSSDLGDVVQRVDDAVLDIEFKVDPLARQLVLRLTATAQRLARHTHTHRRTRPTHTHTAVNSMSRQVCVQLPTYADNVALPASLARRRRCSASCSKRSLSDACRAHSSKPAPDGRTDVRQMHRPDTELGHWVTGSMGHLSRPAHRVIILTRCETRVFPVFEKKPKIKI